MADDVVSSPHDVFDVGDVLTCKVSSTKHCPMISVEKAFFIEILFKFLSCFVEIVSELSKLFFH